MRDNPIFTVADGLFWLSQSTERNSVVRKLQVIKLRGQASLPGLHTFRITDHGLQVFPRTFSISERKAPLRNTPRLSTGVPGMDEMMGGGIPAGDSVIVAGPSGSGKSVLATQFITEGIKQGQAGVIAIFEERPEEYVARSEQLGMDLAGGPRQRELEGPLSAPARPVRGRDPAGNPGHHRRDRRAAPGHRLHERLRDGPGPGVPRRTSASRSTGWSAR